MFGLTKREQRWKAEQEAAELLIDLVKVVVVAVATVEVARAKSQKQLPANEAGESHGKD